MALPGSWREYAKQAIVERKAEQAKLSPSGGNFISFRGGVTSVGGVKMPNPFRVILLATSWQRTYYGKPFNPDASATPDCFSFDKQAPHEKSPEPQNDWCHTCHFNEFGSGTNGQGKGCKEGMRIAIIAADQIKSAEALAAAPIVTGSVSFLNSQTLRNFLGAVFDEEEPWQSITLLFNEPDAKSQYALSFEQETELDDDDVLDLLMPRVQEAKALLAAPYAPIPQAQSAPPPSGRPRRF